MIVTDPIHEEIFAPMQAMFRPPHFDQPETDQMTALRSYTRALRGFDSPTLRAAWTAVVQDWKKPTWPLIGVIVAACREAQKSLRGPQAARTKDTFTARRLAWDKAKTERLAFVAAQNGVAWSFKCAMLYDGKRPEQINIPELKRQKMEATSTKDRIEGNESHFWNGHNIGMLEGDDKQNALVLWAGLERSEQITADEIRRHQANSQPYSAREQEDVKGLL